MKSNLLILSLVLAAHCQKAPTFSLQGYFFVGTPNEAAAQAENPNLVAAMKDIITAIIDEKPDQLLAYVSKKDGAIIDAKAIVPYTQVAVALTDPGAQLHRVLWDDKYWKEVAPRDNIRSYRRIFSSAGEIRIGLFYYSPTECEVRLDFKDRPSMGIMGNPILRKRDDRWYLMNFF